MRLLIGMLVLMGCVEAHAQLDASQVNPQNLPTVWECKGKYSGRELKLRAQLADFNPLLYIESPGMNMFISSENSLQKPLWKSQGGTHLCFASENAGERSLHFLQIVESFLNPARKQVAGEYQRHPKFTGPSSCEALRSKETGQFADSEFLECSYTGGAGLVADYVHRGSLTPDYGFGSQGAAFVSTFGNIKSLVQYQQVRTSSGGAFVMIKGNSDKSTESTIGEIQSDLSVRWFFDDAKISNSILAAAGIKAGKAGVYFSDFVPSKDGRRLSVVGYISDARENQQYRQFVVQVDSTGNLATDFAAKGVGLLDSWIKSGFDDAGPRVESLDDGRLIVVLQTTPAKAAYYTPMRLALVKNGTEESKFREALAKNAELTGTLSHFSHRLTIEPGVKGQFIFIPSREYAEGNKFLAFKISASGEIDRDVFKSVENSFVFEKCTIDSVRRARNGGWFVGGDCNKVYNLIKIREDGSLDTSFGLSGIASSEQWQKQMNTVASLRDLKWTSSSIVETPAGDLIVPMSWNGQMTESLQSGFLKIKGNGQIDTSFAMRGLLSAGLWESKMTVGTTQEVFYNNGIPMSVNTGYQNRNPGLILRRYTP